MKNRRISLRIGICNGNCETMDFIYKELYKKEKLLGINIRIYIFSFEDLVNDRISRCDLIFLELKSEKELVQAVVCYSMFKRKRLLIAIADNDCQAQKLLELEIFRLLVKPLNEKMFDKYFSDAIKKISSTPIAYYFKYNKINYKILLNEIIYFQSDKRITYIITDKKIYQCYKTLGEIEKEIVSTSDSFCRIHQSFLINICYVKSYTELGVELKDGTVLGISRRRKNVTIKTFEEFNIPKQIK